MSAADTSWRRPLARELTRCARATPEQALEAEISYGGKARRIGITGPPGAGKSSLIAMLAKHWAVGETKVGILAVDPTSPMSGGALLGDRIRMDDLSGNPDIFIRSVASGWSADGLCPNVSLLLDAFERADFDDVILETVGVGQVSYAARPLVDSFVLVLVPESGDTIQAMKAGILEVADIYVVNKADLPGAEKLTAELRSIAGWRGQGEGWTPPVILTSASEERGAAELTQAIEAHRDAVHDAARRQALAAARRDHHLRSLFLRRVEGVLADNRASLEGASLADSFRLVVDRLRDGSARQSPGS